MRVPVKSLVLALLAGVAGNGCLTGLTTDPVSFSIFSLLAFGLALYHLYQLHPALPVKGELPLCCGASFLLGALGYTSCIRVAHPELGSNYIPLFFCVVIITWLAIKLELFNKSST